MISNIFINVMSLYCIAEAAAAEEVHEVHKSVPSVSSSSSSHAIPSPSIPPVECR